MLTKIKSLAGPVLRVSRPFWKSSENKIASVLLAVALLSTFFWVLAQYLATEWNRTFYDILQRLDKAAAGDAFYGFLWVSTLVVVATAMQFYFKESLGIRWRKGLTKYCMDLWFHKGNLYFWNHVPNQMDNPDQRISQDVDLFVHGALNLGIELTKQVATAAAFISMLWVISEKFTLFGMYIPGVLVWASVAYSIIGTAFSHLIGNKIAPLNMAQQACEADFRYNLVRSRENAESILLMRGNDAECKKLTDILGRVIHNYARLIHKRTGLTMFTAVYTSFSSALPVLIAAPTFFSGAITLGQIMTISFGFTFVNGAMSYFVTLYASIAEWAAAVKRLDGFIDAMTRAEALGDATEARINDGPNISSKNLQINFPELAQHTRRIHLEVGNGESMMVVGPSGAGKSTFLRVIAGIWPHFDGEVTRPSAQSMMFLPQKPYIPLGCLRKALTYPHSPENFRSGDLKAALEFCELDRFIPQLDHEQSWGQTLSPGEQQRVGWARVYLHKPGILFLDEATSALDQAIQSKLYSSLKDKIPGVTLVSVVHRVELNEYHDSCFDLGHPKKTG